MCHATCWWWGDCARRITRSLLTQRMEFDEIRQILEMMREHELAEFELERGDLKVRLKKQSSNWAVPDARMPLGPPQPLPSAAVPAVAMNTEGSTSTGDEDVEFVIVKSPIVGTFYRAAEPGAKAYVEIGDTVTKGTVLCIIEAMKLMNEINCECEGDIVKVYVENGHAVQYGERLFAIRPR